MRTKTMWATDSSRADLPPYPLPQVTLVVKDNIPGQITLDHPRVD
jgi:hypothetical protein